jgi:hypothetical protein
MKRKVMVNESPLAKPFQVVVVAGRAGGSETTSKQVGGSIQCLQADFQSAVRQAKRDVGRDGVPRTVELRQVLFVADVVREVTR